MDTTPLTEAGRSLVADVLNRAADLIERDGWTQGRYYRDLTGERCVDGAIAADGESTAYDRELARGHLRRTVGGQFIVDWNDAPGRTQAEVVAALRAAAQRSRLMCPTHDVD